MLAYQTMGEVIDYYLAKLEKSVASTVLAPEAAAEEDVRTTSHLCRAVMELTSHARLVKAKADEAMDKRQAVASPRKSVKGVLPVRSASTVPLT